ncbi:MAG: acylphosphatase [Candidatus Dormibacteria bacterium]
MTDSGAAGEFSIVCRWARVEGRVQMVGFRAFAVAEGRQRGLSGWVRNCQDGTVELLVQGPATAVGDFLDTLRHGPEAARVDTLQVADAAMPGDLGRF